MAQRKYDQTLVKRNQQRQDKSLDPSVIHDMMLRFEHPLFDEFEQIDYVVDGNVYSIGPESLFFS